MLNTRTDRSSNKSPRTRNISYQDNIPLGVFTPVPAMEAGRGRRGVVRRTTVELELQLDMAEPGRDAGVLAPDALSVWAHLLVSPASLVPRLANKQFIS